MRQCHAWMDPRCSGAVFLLFIPLPDTAPERMDKKIFLQGKKDFVSQNTTQMSCLPAISSVLCVHAVCCVFECASVCDRGPNLNGDCPFCPAVTAKHPGNLRGPQTKQTPPLLSDFLNFFSRLKWSQCFINHIRYRGSIATEQHMLRFWWLTTKAAIKRVKRC